LTSEKICLRAAHVVVLVGLYLGIALSWPLWFSVRTYPLVPAFPSFHQPSEMLSDIFFFTYLGLLLLTLVPVMIKRAGIGAFCIAVIFCLWDQTRAQEWFLLYNGMILIIACQRVHNPMYGASLLQLTVFATYFWSGIQKVNVHFLYKTFPWLIQPLVGDQSSPVEFFYLFGLIAPIIEFGGAVCLLSRSHKVRKAGVIALIGMHCGILFLVGPLGANWNSVIWPWNIVMSLLLILLFWNESHRPLFGSKAYLFVMGGLFVIPFLTLLNRIDQAFGLSLYSGMKPRALLISSTEQNIDLVKWAIDECNVPPFTSERYFKQIGKQGCDEGKVQMLLIRKPKSRFSKEIIEGTYTCEDLEKQS